MEKEVAELTALPRIEWPGFMRDSGMLRERLGEIERMGREKFKLDRFVADDEDVLREVERNTKVLDEYLASASEFIANVCAGKKWLYVPDGSDVYMPREISWAQKGAWR
jgi:hypothetical protein